MKIYTTYFAALRHIPKTIVPVSISASVPKGFLGLEYHSFAPTYDILSKWKQSHDNEAYTQSYIAQVLSKLSAQKVLQDLETLSKGKDVALVCYEKPGSFCHRHLVTKWFSDNGITCEEYKEEDNRIRIEGL